jgi:hypothetical protein
MREQLVPYLVYTGSDRTPVNKDKYEIVRLCRQRRTFTKRKGDYVSGERQNLGCEMLSLTLAFLRKCLAMAAQTLGHGPGW